MYLLLGAPILAAMMFLVVWVIAPILAVVAYLVTNGRRTNK